MLSEISGRLNWIDIFVIIIIIRTTYIGFMRGFSVEIFKFLGIFTASIISIHYYNLLADFVGATVAFDKDILGVISFMVLWLGSVMAFSFIFNLFTKFIRLEAVSSVNKWGGCALGILRGFFILGLVVITFRLTNTTYLKNSIEKSFSANTIADIAFINYRNTWSGVVMKFFPKEDVNYAVLGKKGAQEEK